MSPQEVLDKLGIIVPSDGTSLKVSRGEICHSDCSSDFTVETVSGEPYFDRQHKYVLILTVNRRDHLRQTLLAQLVKDSWQVGPDRILHISE